MYISLVCFLGNICPFWVFSVCLLLVHPSGCLVVDRLALPAQVSPSLCCLGFSFPVGPPLLFFTSLWLFVSRGLVSSLPLSLILQLPLALEGFSLLPRSNLRFPPRWGPLGRVSCCLASLHSSFACPSPTCRTFSMSASSCFYTALFPVCGPSLCLLSSLGVYFLLLLVVSLLLGFTVSAIFAIWCFPCGVFLRLPPALFSASAPSCGSSWTFFLLLVAFSSFLFCHGASFLGGFSYCRVGSLSLWLFPVRYLFRPCWVSLPCILRFLASFGYVLAFFLFTSFVTRSNLSSFATGSSLRAESPLSVVACLLSLGFGSCPLVFGVFPLLGILLSFLLLFVEWVTLCFVRSSLEFLYPSLFVAGLHFPSAFVFLFLLFLSAALSSWEFSQHASYTVAVFSCSIHVRLQLCYTFPLICCTFFPYCWRRDSGKFPRLLPQVFSFDSSVPLRPLRLASSSIPSGPLCQWR